MIPQAHKKINMFCDYNPQLISFFIDFENKKISIQHTVVTAKVNGTVTEIVRDKTKTKSSCRTLPLIPACEQMLNNWDTVTSAQQAAFIHIWISPVRYLLPMPSSGSSRRRQKCENEPDAGDKKEKQPKILRFQAAFQCRWWGSNPHVLLAQGILSPPRLPFRHTGVCRTVLL